MSATARPVRAVRLPITCCNECRRSYDLGEWDELAHVKMPDADPKTTLEWRRCACGNTLGLDSSSRSLDQYWPEELYRSLFPTSQRPAVAFGKRSAIAGVLRKLADWIS